MQVMLIARPVSVATYDVNAKLIASHTQASVEFIKVFYLEAFAQCNAYHHLAWRSVHGEDVADIDHGTLVTQVLHINIGQVEMYTFHQHVGSHQHLLVGIVHHRTVIAYTINSRGILVFISFGEMVYQSKLTQLSYIQDNL